MDDSCVNEQGLLRTGTHGPTSDFMGGFSSGGFYPLISLPTRLTDTTATLIDNIWTNNLGVGIGSGLVMVRVSDHLPVFAFVGGGGPIEGQGSGGVGGRRRLVNEGRIGRFAEELEGWAFDVEGALGVEGNVARFRNAFRDLYDARFPWVEDKRNRRDIEKPWLDDAEFKGLVREKGELYSRKLRGLLDEEGGRRLVEVNRTVGNMRQRLKRAYFNQRLGEIGGDLRATWEVLGEVLRGRKGQGKGAPCRYFLKEGVPVTDGARIAEGFCDFYCQVGPGLASRIGRERDGAFLEYMGERVEESLIWSPTTPFEVEELCRSLAPRKGMGWDGVSPRVIRGVARELSGSLSRLFNCCMRGGFYPACFKVARVVPVFKGGDPTEFSNYRPVSVLPVLSQLFERVLQKRLVAFFDRHRVIVPGQYGFRAGHSTSMAVLDMVERVRGAWEKGDVSLGVFIDLKKAFDTVDHQLLLGKLEHYGVRGQTLELLRSYLEGRAQYVQYGGFESESGQVKCGVPQGSVLGPLFFLIYVNDMVRACRGLDLVLFADDTNIFAQGRDPAELFGLVNGGLGELSRWFRCNRLTLNLKKTEFVYFGGPGARGHLPEGLGLEIGVERVVQVDGSRFLGVWVDGGLRWSGQIEQVRTKVARLLGVLGRAGEVLSSGSLLSLYNALVLPHLQYCLMVWGDFKGGRNLTVGGALLRYQKRFAGLVAGKRGRYHADPLLAQHGMLKVEDLYRQQLRVHAWRFWRGRLPENQAAMLGRIDGVHGYGTRAARGGLYLSTRDHGSVGYRVPKEWAALGEDHRGLASLAAFKRRSRAGFLAGYGGFECRVVGCGVCAGGRVV